MDINAESFQAPDFGNLSACPNQILSNKISETTVIASVLILGIINAAVIAGNILVIVAVFVSHKLRTVTNFFIVSLAVADLLVGIIVLPYSITLETLDVWIFGEIWCQVWLAVDVWMCTSSILNLCAISVDRYLAVTRPFKYRSIMSSRRAKMLIAAVWVLSFIICFPPLVGWNDKSTQIATYTPTSFTDSSGSAPDTMSMNGRSSDEKRTNAVPVVQSNNGQSGYHFASNTTTFCIMTDCALINNKGYVVYSALGSFYIPMLVMLFFYWRIYLVASGTTKALKRGYRTTKSQRTKGENNGSYTEERLTLRIHRGYPISDFSGGGESSSNSSARHNQHHPTPRRAVTKVTKNPQSPCPCGDRRGGSGSSHESEVCFDKTSSSGTARFKKKSKKKSKKSASQTTTCSDESGHVPKPTSSRIKCLVISTKSVTKPSEPLVTKLSKRTAKRFHAETKAAKTVGVIVGGFICCWLPFFTVYLTRAFCDECIPDLLFSIFFWLGYCNSAINPFIYALFSKDFRNAFKNIICRCKFREETVSSLIRQIHLPTFFEDMPEDKGELQ